MTMEAEKNHFDVIVIGSGPGGEGAAIKLAKAGKSVAIVENHLLVGGGCTHLGTIPSKTLIHVVQKYADEKKNRLFDRGRHPGRVTCDDLMIAMQNVVDNQVRDREDFYERNDITIIAGQARFTDPHNVEISDLTGNQRSCTADYFVIASGSHPYHPEDVHFDNQRVVDSDTILQMQELPGTLTVYGAGVIGCEYASAFKNIGVKVNLINTRERLLEYLDDEISSALSYHMRDEQGVMIRQNEEYERVEVNDQGVVLHLKTGKVIKSDMLLWANGRTGNSEGLGLETLGIEPDHRGNIKVNEAYQTRSAAYLRGGRYRRLPQPGQRRLRPGPVRRDAHCRRLLRRASGQGYPDRHLHPSGDQLPRWYGARVDRADGSLTRSAVLSSATWPAARSPRIKPAC